MKFYEEHYTSIFKKSDIIYLTADSPNVLDKLEDGKVYIIGALVDHNAYKVKKVFIFIYLFFFFCETLINEIV